MEKSISAADFRHKFSQVVTECPERKELSKNQARARLWRALPPFKDNRSAADFARESHLTRFRAEPVLKVTRSKRNRTMVRAFELLAGLPNDPQPSVEKGRPQKRKGLWGAKNFNVKEKPLRRKWYSGMTTYVFRGLRERVLSLAY